MGVPEHMQPLTIAIAGTPCTPWTKFAAAKRGAGPAHSAMESWFLWLNDVRCQNYDLVFFENSDHFVPEMFCSSFPSHYLVKFGVWSPHETG